MDEWDRSKHLGRSQTDIQKLRHQLKLIKENYFFDESEAEALYKVERNKADAAALQAKLRGQTQVPKPKSQASTSTSSTPSSSHVATTSSSITDVFEGDDGDSEGGVLDLLEPMPDTQLAEDGTVVNIRDMALPKNWSGRTPKTLLAETVNKADRYAVIAYTIVSGLSRAKRAAVDIRWEGRKASSWSMVDVACHDEGQSEQYIALVALHAITFPKLEGFAASASSSQHITSFRLLPPVFRDLWEELEDRRRCEDNMENRNAWGRLKNILKPKLGTNDKVIQMHIKGFLA
jgi:ATP-dependent RNA helicase DHX29